MSIIDPKTVKIDQIWICMILREIFLVKIRWKQVYIRLQNSQNQPKKDLHDFAGGFFRENAIEPGLY